MSSQAPCSSSHSFLSATILRRSTVSLQRASPISNADIISLVKHAVLHSPSPFHVQSARAVILLHSDHNKFWSMTHTACQKATPPAQFEGRFASNLAAFSEAYGTVLFFDDASAVDGMPPMISNLIESFPEWAEHSNGMTQYIVWTALCSAGLGCNLQHLQRYVGPALNEAWNLPESWVCKAQLVFGTPGGPPRGGVEKKFADIEDRVKVFEGCEK